jgi:hypothetical protein
MARIKNDQTRNLNPHAEAVAAMWLYSGDYAHKGLGSMDYYDQLSDYRKDCCRRLVEDVLKKQGHRATA